MSGFRLLRLATGLVDALGTVVLAPACVACGDALDAPTRGPVCQPCWDRIPALRPPYCDACGVPLPSWRVFDSSRATCPDCRRAPAGALTRVRAIGSYDGTLRVLVQRMKYAGHSSLARRLGHLARSAGRDVLDGADYVVPVPLHPVRRLQRGFNQAALIAGALGIKELPALRRARWTPTQTGLSAPQRQQNVDRAFALSYLLRLRGTRRAVKNRTLVLVDDVRTTGATLDACARVLLAAGAAEIRALIVARAEPPRPPSRGPR